MKSRRSMKTNVFSTLFFCAAIAMMCSASFLCAQTVNVEDAMQKAMEFHQRRAAKQRGQTTYTEVIQPQLAYTAKEQEHPLYYVFNYAEGGFAIIGGDEATADILGYSDAGRFCYDSIPDGMQYMLLCCQELVTGNINQQQAAGRKASPKYQAASSKTSIAPLLNTRWDQHAPYNNLIPYGFPTGCVATATAQIMKHYNSPVTGKESRSYTRTYSWSTPTTVTFEADFANTTYDWDNMLDRYDSNATEAQKLAVATLMYHVGVAVDMDYNYGGSAAYSSMVGNLKSFFGYSPNAKYCEHMDYWQQWEDLLYKDLSAGHPVYYSGHDGSTGHAFVCDGYDAENGLYHFNWGWGGRYDCYLSVSGNTNFGAGGHSFSQGQAIWFNLVPKDLDPTVVEVTEITLNKTEVEVVAGDHTTLNVDQWPLNANKTWPYSESSNPDVASVNGWGTLNDYHLYIRAFSPGKTTITIWPSNEKGDIYATCEVTVTEIGSVTIGSEQSTTNILPFATNQQYSTTQTLYTSQEIGQSGFICSIGYKALSTAEQEDEFEIWMGATSATSLDADDCVIDESKMQKVFTGKKTVGKSTGWERFSFRTPYFYNKKDNLLIVVAKKSSLAQPYQHAQTATSGIRCLRRSGSESAMASITNNTNGYIESSYRPDIRLWINENTALMLGYNVYYNFKDDGTFRIFGSGPADENVYLSTRPWLLYHDQFRSLVVDEGVTTLPGYLAYPIGTLESISLPSTLESYPMSTFQSIQHVKEIKVAPENPRYSDGDGLNVLIDKQESRMMLSSIYNSVIPDNVKSLGINCFRNNLSSEILLPNRITDIGSYCFEGSAIREITIPEGVSYLYNSFHNCRELRNVYIKGTNIGYIEYNPFMGCPMLEYISMPDQKKYFYCIDNGQIISTNYTKTPSIIVSTQSTVIPTEVLDIGSNAFAEQVSLKEISLHEGFSTIASNAFVDATSLRRVKLPNSLTRIQYSVFENTPLTTLYVGQTPAKLITYNWAGETLTPFSNIASNYEDRVLYVPKGCKAAYQAVELWTTFARIEEYADPSQITTASTLLYSTEVTAARSEQIEVLIDLKSDGSITGISCHVTLPDGIVPLFDADGEPQVTLNAERCTNHTVTASWCKGKLELTITSPTGQPFKGQEGVLCTIGYQVASDAQAGRQIVELTDVSLTGAGSQLNYVSDIVIEPFQMGDVNHDGSLTSQDAVGIGTILLEGDTQGLMLHRADVNRDSKISLSDITGLVKKGIMGN